MAERSAETETIGGTGVAAAGATVSVLQQAMASGALTSAGLTEFYLSRIERLNPLLRAVISVNPGAGSEAAASDQMRVGSAARGPLEGIPVLVKDNVAARGLPATAGSPALLEAESGDAFLVTRLRAAGAVIIGKANMSEWANFRSTHSTSGWSTLGGQAANPYALDRSPSGSSSGSGVAVAGAPAPAAGGRGGACSAGPVSCRYRPSRTRRARWPARWLTLRPCSVCWQAPTQPIRRPAGPPGGPVITRRSLTVAR